MRTLIFFLFSLPIVYVLVTFIAWEYNPAHWSAGLRCLYLLGLLLSTSALIGRSRMIAATRANAYEREQNRPEA